MKYDVFSLTKTFAWLLAFVWVGMTISCTTEDPVETEDPIASFQFDIDDEDFLKVTFSNFSQNATSYSWNFGDGNTSTDENPVHTYDEAGTYEVELTATNAAGVSVSRKENVTLTDPLAAQRALFGDNGKTWSLIADVSTGSFPLEVGPAARNEIWWALGRNEALCVRECIFDDTWTFNPDGNFTYENNGDYYGDSRNWADALVTCFDATDAANYVGRNGQDLSSWNSGTHPYTYDVTKAELTIQGGFIGLPKVGTDAEYDDPQSSVTYKVVKLVDAAVDTLVLETVLQEAGGYWKFTLVSYDNANDKVVVGDCEPVTNVDVTFRLNFNTYDGTGTPALNGTFNNWCGECNVMTDADDDGIWEITLPLPVNTTHEYKFTVNGWTAQEELTEGMSCTVTNNGFTNRSLSVGEANVSLGTVCWNSCDNCPVNFVAADLQGKEWKLVNGPGAVRVGPYIGGGDWWTNDQVWADAGPCLFDDTFTFGTDGAYTIDLKDEVFTETHMEGITANGCLAVGDLPAALAAWGGGDFSYTFAEKTAEAPAKITVTGTGAYFGFYKAANGSEPKVPVVDGAITYTVLSYAERANRDILEVTVDISAAQDGTAWWTFKLAAAK